MAQFDSFLFEGHGKSEVTGAFDPGAVNGNVTEHQLVELIVKEAKMYLDKTGLNIHYDENNYADKDLAGNTYKFKCGVSVHINSTIGATGVEIFVPMKEKYLGADFKITSEISKALNIPNRGVKSRSYETELTHMRKDGLALSGTDYYGEIRDAWNRGISLAILEVGFIQNDLAKIQANIKKLGFLVAQYIASNCDKTVTEIVTPPPVASATYRVIVDSKQIGAYGVIDNVINETKKALTNGAKAIEIQRI